MKVEVTMPQMGESVAEGTIIKWNKKIGEQIQQDETLLEISTDKVDSEIPSSVSGVIAEILYQENETVEVGTVIAFVETEIETTQKKTEPESSQDSGLEKPGTKISEKKPVIKLPDKGEKKGKLFLSPLVRKLVLENQISEDQLSQIFGSGRNGRITRDDMLAYIKQNVSIISSVSGQGKSPRQEFKSVPDSAEKFDYDPRQVEIINMDHIRKATAEHMLRSIQTSPHVVTFAEVDMSNIVNLRENVKKDFESKNGYKLTFTAFFIEAAAHALKEFPYLNASVDKDKIILKKQYNIGMAVAAGQNLIVPVIKNADQKNLAGLARSVHELTEKTRNKKLHPDDVQDGTFTITNPGIFGNITGIAIINQPQVAILNCGAIIKRPVVIEDAIAIRPIMWISLSYDHRIIDGAMASKFIQKIVQILENYEKTTSP